MRRCRVLIFTDRFLFGQEFNPQVSLRCVCIHTNFEIAETLVTPGAYATIA